MTLLAGKRLVITGVLTRDSIAWAVASEAQQAGAELVLTSFGRALRLTERAAAQLPVPCDVLELDVTKPDHLSAVRADLATRWQGVDGLLHAIAYAPSDAIGGRFLDTPALSALTAFETSAFSLKTLASGFLPLFSNRASIAGLDFDASVAWPAYDWMGVSKAALESVSRYVARDLGRDGIRCNLVAAGPLRTAAASGIAGFAKLAATWAAGAPLGWDPDDATPVARAVCFLLSDWSAGISGEILHVDGGFHAMGAGFTGGGR
ncbi:MAG: meromycolic acid enoyl-[acyl-carrier-protein] reductase [Thermoleophilaceae bacterium]|nr:meromycolic acid enoyl-[acyl-carrier-protein] reductase [Thermoleophilaceae bacterium]